MQKILEEKKPKVIVEDGGGEHSTRLFIESSATSIITVEEDKDWFEKLKVQFPYASQDKWLILRKWTIIVPNLYLRPGLHDVIGNKISICSR